MANEERHSLSDDSQARAESPEPNTLEDDIKDRWKTWAGRNPTKAKIPIPQRKVRKGHNNEARKIRESEQQAKREAMAKEIEEIQEQYYEQLREVGTKYGRSFETVVNYVSYSSRYKKQRAPSLYLAKVSAKAEEINKDKPIGDRVHLDEIRKMVKDEEDASDYEGMTKDEEKALLDRLLEKRTIKVQGARRSNEGAAVDCRQVINSVNCEIEGLAHRTGAQFVGFMSRSDIHDTFQPTLVSDSPASLTFFKRIVGMSAEEILVKFEQFSTSHANSIDMNDREDSKDVRVQCTDLILQGLHTFRYSNLRMNYVNYETDIVARHHVKIDGWPIGIKFESLSNLKNLQDLRRLRDALKTTACKWVSMSQAQIDRHAKELERCEEAGEIIKKKRQERSDAHTTKPKNAAKRKKRTRNMDNNSKSDEHEEREDSNGDGEESNSENRMLPRKHPWRSSKENVAFRSCSVIDEDST
ncbi:uncharacterized protein EV420DRAFT_1270943 [Desarmillaria tabescens]|uniref:Uncharacterized protein n=1 Tax=Armillaria tabescens TaxID=1929756 RepID=A0AA39KDJ5_ARMTA|nr:uncharacterized protein EV420DRAFT_1270943 [Desarmillaria tabescens]KAK0457965.1 hypothetical protein EV420DRAFT_1270943 [Desarmillaria tabescens]